MNQHFILKKVDREFYVTLTVDQFNHDEKVTVKWGRYDAPSNPKVGAYYESKNHSTGTGTFTNRVDAEYYFKQLVSALIEGFFL